MSQKLFYICGLVGIIIAGALGSYLEHFSLIAVIIGAIVTPIVFACIGTGRRKHVLK